MAVRYVTCARRRLYACTRACERIVSLRRSIIRQRPPYAYAYIATAPFNPFPSNDEKPQGSFGKKCPLAPDKVERKRVSSHVIDAENLARPRTAWAVFERVIPIFRNRFRVAVIDVRA